MSSQNINRFFDKLDQLRALVAFGQQAMPFIEELFEFIREVAPLMEDINHSLRDSTGKIPRATSQIQSVSQATELATTEILDLVDKVLDKSHCLEERLQRSSEHVDRVQEVDGRLIALLRRELGDERGDLLEQVERLHAEKQELEAATGAEIEAEQALLGELRSQANQIMMSLQVQDITSQQLSAVNHLIESIRARLTNLVQRLDEEPGEEEEFDDSVDDGTFNPDAVYDPSGSLQHNADAVADAFRRGETAPDIERPRPAETAAELPVDAAGDGAASDGAAGDGAAAELASQDDIDALFGGTTTAAEPTPAEDPPAESSGPASQDDIDDLFANGF